MTERRSQRRLPIVATAAVALVIILILATAFLRPFSASPTTETTTPTLSKGRIMLTGECQPCSYDNALHYSLAQQEQDISMLKGLGFTSIRIDLGFDAWLSENRTAVAVETSVVDYVTSHGLTLIIADAGAERYRSFALPWAQFKAAWVQRVRTLAGLYQPDYYIVIKEPGWYVPMVSDARINPQFQSSRDWDNLSGWLADTVLSVSPNTTVAVSIGANGLNKEPQFYTSFLTGLPARVGVLGFDTYGPSDNQAMETFLSEHGDQGKQVWDAEAWSQPAANSNPDADPAWLASQYNLCISLGVSELDPFYSNDFVTYVTQNPTTFAASTPVATEMQSIAAKNR